MPCSCCTTVFNNFKTAGLQYSIVDSNLQAQHLLSGASFQAQALGVEQSSTPHLQNSGQRLKPGCANCWGELAPYQSAAPLAGKPSIELLCRKPGRVTARLRTSRVSLQGSEEEAMRKDAPPQKLQPPWKVSRHSNRILTA